MPKGWEFTPLNKLAIARMGKTILAKELSSDGVPVYSAGQENRPWGYVSSTDLQFGDTTVVLSARGSIGFPKLPLVTPFVSTQTTIALRAKSRAIAEWLNWWLKTIDWKEMTSGAAIPMLTIGQINELQVPVAPPEVQRRVIDKLDKIAARLDDTTVRLDSIPIILKRFRMSVLAAACSGRLTEDWRKMKKFPIDTAEHWESCSFGELIADGPQNGLYKPASAYGPGVLILRIDSFYDGQVTDWTKLKRLRLSKDEQKNFALANGDIVVNRVNSMPYLGKSALVRNLPEACVFESNMMRIRLDRSRVEPEYAIRYLNSPQGLVELRQNAKQAVNQASINQQDVMAVVISLPPLDEQVEIVRRADAMFKQADAIEDRYRKAHAFTKKLMPSVLSKAFRGELISG